MARTLKEQMALPTLNAEPTARANGLANKLDPRDRPFHDWYRFVLSFPPHLVRRYVVDFCLQDQHLVLDPFCGTGTTLVECKLRGIRSVGLEANPIAHFASSVKTDWSVDPVELKSYSLEIARSAREILKAQGIDDVSPFEGKLKDIPLRTLEDDKRRLILTNSISPIPLHKTLILLECLNRHSHESYYRHAVLALAKSLVFIISNLHFGPEVGVGKPKHDAPVILAWLSEVDKICNDLRGIAAKPHPKAMVHNADARKTSKVLPPSSVDAVITSPPYPNEKDYTRTTRLESVLLGFINSRSELRELKRNLVRSNTRSVYKSDDDDRWVAEHPEIERIAKTIERRRQQLGKTSGFERMYPRVTRLYFGGLVRHLADLRDTLRPGAQLAYVVGDQASYLRVLIRTGELLADISKSLGYELVRIDLFRTRFATATKEELREEVVVLKWKG